MPPRRPALAEYWAARARSSFWPTRQLSYRLGAVLAWCLGRAGLTPNAVSLLSLAVAGAGLGAALWLCPPGLAQGLAIFCALNVSYALDCADGLMARVHGSGTRFGAFFDKFIDVLVLALTIGVLGAAAGTGQWQFIDLPPALGVAFALGARLALCVLMWLKEFEGKLPQRGREDRRRRDLTWFLRRGSGLVCDQLVYITILSAAWGCGAFWDALWLYHGLIAILSAAYLVALYREES